MRFPTADDTTVWHIVPALGEFPRFLTLTPDGRRLLVANERSHTIVSRTLDAHSLVPQAGASVIETGSPVCIVFRTGESAKR